jgi:hypothetical protein
MRCRLSAPALILLFSLSSAGRPAEITLREQLDRPFASLFEVTEPNAYGRAEYASLRSDLQRERDEQLDLRHAEAKRYQTDLNEARRRLTALNDQASKDSPAAAARRAELHVQVAALERVLLENKKSETEIGRVYEAKLAKLTVIEQWPRRRMKIDNRIHDGRARSRKHGDIEDIRYRKLGEERADDAVAGQRAMREMTASGLLPPQIQDAGVQRYVSNLVDRIAANSDWNGQLHPMVLDSSEIIAIGLPGGFLFVTTGLISAADDESQLAGVMSRQIANIAARHRFRRSKRTVIPKMIPPALQVGTGILTGGASSAAAYYGMNAGFQGVGALVDRMFSGDSRKFQTEDDQLGIQYAWNADIDPKGFIFFVDALARDKKNSNLPAEFQTSDLAKRLIDVFAEIEYLPAKAYYTTDSPEFQRVKQRLKQNPSR